MFDNLQEGRAGNPDRAKEEPEWLDAIHKTKLQIHASLFHDSPSKEVKEQVAPKMDAEGDGE